MMMHLLASEFPAGAWLLDTEYRAPRGEHVIPVCLVAKEFFTGRLIRQFFEPGEAAENPLPREKALFIAFSAHAEWSVFRSLGWQLPRFILDLAVEFRNETAGRTPPSTGPWKGSLLEAMQVYKLDSMAAVEKKSMRSRILAGPPYSAEEREAILAYCTEDVLALAALLPRMAPAISLPHAIFRGVFTHAASAIEWNGLPVDVENYERLIKYRERVKAKLVERYEGEHGPCPYSTDAKGTVHFRKAKLAEHLGNLGILPSWKLTPTKKLKTSEEYMAEMARQFPVLAPLATLMQRVADLRNFDLAIGADNRSRFPSMPFRTATSRSQPPSRAFIFSQSSWARSFLKPARGQFLAYIDWSAAEFAIAGALSQDQAMLQSYLSGDVYLGAGVSLGLLLKDATRESHADDRGVLKVWLLSTMYGASAGSLVRALSYELLQKLPSPYRNAEDFIARHARTYSRYWEWSAGRLEILLHEKPHCEILKMGWKHHVDRRLKSWQIRNRALNVPMQQLCAEIMRWAATWTVQAGIELQATIHDALCVGGPIEDAEKIVATTKACMDRASTMLIGFPMRTDVKVVKYPDRYEDGRGAKTWKTIMALVDEVECEADVISVCR